MRHAGDLPVTAVLSQVAAVVQDSALFSASVDDNILYGMDRGGKRREHLEQAVRDASAEASASGFIEELPEGYRCACGHTTATIWTVRCVFFFSSKRHDAFNRLALSQWHPVGPCRECFETMDSRLIVAPLLTAGRM